MAALKRLLFLLLNFRNEINRIHENINIIIDKNMKISPRILIFYHMKKPSNTFHSNIKPKRMIYRKYDL